MSFGLTCRRTAGRDSRQHGRPADAAAWPSRATPRAYPPSVRRAARGPARGHRVSGPPATSSHAAASRRRRDGGRVSGRGSWPPSACSAGCTARASGGLGRSWPTAEETPARRSSGPSSAITRRSPGPRRSSKTLRSCRVERSATCVGADGRPAGGRRGDVSGLSTGGDCRVEGDPALSYSSRGSRLESAPFQAGVGALRRRFSGSPSGPCCMRSVAGQLPRECSLGSCWLPRHPEWATSPGPAGARRGPSFGHGRPAPDSPRIHRAVTSATASAAKSAASDLRVVGMVDSWVQAYARSQAPATRGEVQASAPDVWRSRGRPDAAVTIAWSWPSNFRARTATLFFLQRCSRFAADMP